MDHELFSFLEDQVDSVFDIPCQCLGSIGGDAVQRERLGDLLGAKSQDTVLCPRMHRSRALETTHGYAI